MSEDEIKALIKIKTQLESLDRAMRLGEASLAKDCFDVALRDVNALLNDALNRAQIS